MTNCKKKEKYEKLTIFSVRKASIDLFGKRRSSYSGELGISHYEWGKYNPNLDRYVKLNEKEQAVKVLLLKKYFGTIQEDVIFIQEDVDKGLITKEEAWDILTKEKLEKGNFIGFLKEFEELTGVQLVRCTAVELTTF